MEKKKATTQRAAAQQIDDHGNTAAAQRARLLAALKCGPVDTVYAYRKLDILHVPRRVFELRKMGHNIVTRWVERVTEAGERHRVGLYMLEGA